MGDGEVADNSEATTVALGEYKSNFDQVVLSAIGSSIATGGNILQAIKNDGRLYKLVNNIELASAGNGRYYGWSRGASGKFNGQGEFAKVGGAAAVVASQVFAQGMLIQISFQLAELQAAIQEIKDEIIQLEISRLNGSIKSINRDLNAFRNTGNKAGLGSSLSSATAQFTVVCDAVGRMIDQTESKPKFWSKYDWPFRPKTQEVVARQCSLIGMGLKCLCNSIQSIALGYSVYDPKTGRKAAFDCINEINSLKLGKLQEDLRVLPYDKWGDFEDKLEITRGLLPPLLKNQGKRPIFILSGNEIHNLIEGTANG